MLRFKRSYSSAKNAEENLFISDFLYHPKKYYSRADKENVKGICEQIVQAIKSPFAEKEIFEIECQSRKGLSSKKKILAQQQFFNDLCRHYRIVREERLDHRKLKQYFNEFFTSPRRVNVMFGAKNEGQLKCYMAVADCFVIAKEQNENLTVDAFFKNDEFLQAGNKVFQGDKKDWLKDAYKKLKNTAQSNSIKLFNNSRGD